MIDEALALRGGPAHTCRHQNHGINPSEVHSSAAASSPNPREVATAQSTLNRNNDRADSRPKLPKHLAYLVSEANNHQHNRRQE